MRGRALPLEPIDFSQRNLEFIGLRANEDLHFEDIAKKIGIALRTVYVWDKHEPFRDAIMALWQRRVQANDTLAAVVHNRLLMELERRTREKWLKALTLKEIHDTIKAVKDEHTGTTVNVFNQEAAGRSLADVCSGERQEIERVANLCDEGSDIGSFIAEVTGDRPVPATAPPGETGQ